MAESIKSEVELVNSKVVESLNISGYPLCSKKIPKWISSVRDAKRDTIENCMGDVGCQLKNFINVVDINHFGIDSIISRFDDKNIEIIEEMLKTTDYLVESQATNLLKLYKDLSAECPVIKSLIQNDLLTKPPVRMLRDKNLRNEIRANGFEVVPTGKDKIVDLENSLRRMTWNGFKNIPLYDCNFDTPDTMLAYTINNNYKEYVVENSKKVKERFLNLGMKSQAISYANKLVEWCNSNVGERYFDFYYVPLQTTACILGKINTFSVQEIGMCKATSDDAMYLELLNTLVPNDTFKSSNTIKDVCVNEPASMYKVLSKRFCGDGELDIHKVSESGVSIDFSYEARMYRLGFFNKFLQSDFVRNTVENLDNCKKYGGSCLFDHFWVVVPTIDLGADCYFHRKENRWYLSLNGEIKGLYNKEDVCREFDVHLVKNNVVRPIILGEVDGKFVFICYWD